MFMLHACKIDGAKLRNPAKIGLEAAAVAEQSDQRLYGRNNCNRRRSDTMMASAARCLTPPMHLRHFSGSLSALV
jgi:hypothetical protein